MDKREISIKGGKMTKKVTIENIETKANITFNSAKESDNYVRDVLGFTLRDMEKIRHEPVNGYRRIKLKHPDAI